MDLESALADGHRILERFGQPHRVSMSDFQRWFEANTPYPDITIEEVVLNPLLVVHEIVEICEFKKTGIALTKDVIVANLELVDEAHFKATEVELEIAFALGNTDHVIDRLQDVRAWGEDPLTKPAMRQAYAAMSDRAERALRELEKEREKG
jgi:hypothetical protein